MKIIYLANVRIPTEKAHGVQIMHTCSELAARGQEITLVVPRRHTLAVDPFEYYGVAKSFRIVRVWCINAAHLGPVGFVLQSLSFALLAAWYVFTHKADVVYGRDPGALMFAPHRVRVFELHAALKSSLKYFTHVVTISNGLREYAIGRGVQPEKVSVAHDATILTEFQDKTAVRARLNLPQDIILVAYVGKYTTMGMHKGVKEIITGVGATKGAGLLVVGLEPDEIGEVTALAHEAIPTERTFILGHVPHAQALAYMRAADILVMNYPKGIHFARYMSPLKLFEYLGAGNAILTSDLPAVREILDERTAQFFAPEDQSALTAALTSLVADAAKREALGRAGRALATEHTYAHRAEKLERVLASLV